MEIPEYQVLLNDIITGTSYSGISFKDCQPHKDEGNLRGGWGDPGGLHGFGEKVLPDDMFLALAAIIHYEKNNNGCGYRK